MFHTRKATVALDKVYALLGMSSDDPSAARLSADYGASWETIFRKLVAFSLSNRVSVEIWDEKEVAVISGKGFVLGEVSVVEGDTTTWKNTPEDRSQSFTPPASAKPIQPRDVIYLLPGASKEWGKGANMSPERVPQIHPKSRSTQDHIRSLGPIQSLGPGAGE
jgi:hypothetical protein